MIRTAIAAALAANGVGAAELDELAVRPPTASLARAARILTRSPSATSRTCSGASPNRST